jgi:hypothetical protein
LVWRYRVYYIDQLKQPFIIMAKIKAKRSAMAKKLEYDVAEQLRTPEEMAAHLGAWFEETSMMRPALPALWGTLHVHRERPKSPAMLA